MFSQTISMNFPKFAGKTYMFVLFQGNKTLKEEGIIPSSGKFILKVPDEIRPYRGMARWLLTNSPEGGGLDMTIHEKDFSIECLENNPNDSNIKYLGNDETFILNKFYQKGKSISDRYDALKMTVKLYSEDNVLKKILLEKMKEEEINYSMFQTDIENSQYYAAKFINIVNITEGIGNKLYDTDKKRIENIIDFIVYKLDMNDLFTSGHWSTVLSFWANNHLRFIKNPLRMRSEFITISQKIKQPLMYTQFAEVVTSSIIREGRDDLVEMLYPLVTQSGKIIEYKNGLEVYEKGRVGDKAPHIITYNENQEKIEKPFNLPNDHGNTLIIFYQSACSYCNDELNKINEKYKNLLSTKTRIIAISADMEEDLFKRYSKNYLWNEFYNDFKGFEGENFKNYGVRGTPTIFLINDNGIIIKRAAKISDILN